MKSVFDEKKEKISMTTIRERSIASPYAISVIKACELVRKCLDENTCDNFINYFEKVNHGKSTRNCSHLLKLQKFKLEYSRGAFYYMGAKLYNDLSLTIRKTENFNEFKKQLKNYAFLNF